MPAIENQYAAAVVKAPCPGCGKRLEGDGLQNPFRPFCSERCKLADLGAWFAQRYAVPADPEEPETPPESPRQ